jgi:hypothetical protein
MYKSIRRFLCFLLVLQLIIPYTTFAAAVGRFTSVVGDVKQTRAKRVIKPVAKSPIQMKDLIATALTSSATMVFSDDSTIKLSENTKLEIKEFLFKDKSRRGVFSLAIGKMTADVKKYIGGDNVFEVQSPTAVVGVRGTGFEYDEAVNAQNQGVATVACTEGSLNLSALSATREVVSTAVLEAGQVAVIIGGVITISAIGAALGAATIAKATETGAAGGAGGAGTGGAATGGGATTATAAGSGTTVAAGGAAAGTATATTAGAATAATVGTAAAATGLSTAAIAGIAIGGAAVVGGAAAVAGGGGGGSSSSGTTPTSCSNPDGQWTGTYSGTRCNSPQNGTFVVNCSNCSCTGIWNDSSGQTVTGTCTSSGVSVSCIINTRDCSYNSCQRGSSGTISGNSQSGTYSGCGASGNYTGTKQ